MDWHQILRIHRGSHPGLHRNRWTHCPGIWALIDYAQRRKTLRRAQRDVDEVALGLVADYSQVTGQLKGGDPAEGSNTMDNGAGGRVKTEV